MKKKSTEIDLYKIILKRFNNPIHISHISDYIFRKNISETKEVLNRFIDDGVIEESNYAKEYYVLKKK